MTKSNLFIQKGLFVTAFVILTAIFAQIEIPLPYVPISGQTLAVGLTATVLGSFLGAISLLVYAVLGAIGLPVFAGFDGGLDVLMGPTGGYILGFIVAAFVIGLWLEKKGFTIKETIIANIIGMVIILVCGVIQLKFVLAMTWPDALAVGVYPFIITGLLKACAAGWGGIKIRDKLPAILKK